MNQPQLPGLPPTSFTIPARKKVEMLLQTGTQISLGDVKKELEDLRKQHPSAPGLTIALAVVDRRIAEATLITSRIVLAEAVKAGLAIENCLVASRIVGDEIVVTAEPGDGV